MTQRLNQLLWVVVTISKTRRRGWHSLNKRASAGGGLGSPADIAAQDTAFQLISRRIVLELTTTLQKSPIRLWKSLMGSE